MAGVQTEEQEVPLCKMTPECFVQMLEKLHKIFGSAGLSMIFHMGKQKGISEASEVFGSLASDDAEHTKAELVDQCLERAARLGWGVMEVTRLDLVEGNISIALRESPFESICLGQASPRESICSFTRGYVSGILSEIAEEKMEYSGSSCPATGDERCEIRLTRSQAPQREGAAAPVG
jgi:predicted hydrocarbon binding protein